jgi:hypothetical protein
MPFQHKTANNTNGIRCTTVSCNTLDVQDITISGNLVLESGQIEESCLAISGTISPFICNYAVGNVFYIPTTYEPTANYNIIIQNIPTDTTKTYFVTIINRQATGTFYGNGVRVSDTSSSYTFSGASGTNSSSTYCIPYQNGGVPTIVTTPNIIVQQFSIVSVANSSSVFTRYITTSVSQFY